MGPQRRAVLLALAQVKKRGKVWKGTGQLSGLGDGSKVADEVRVLYTALIDQINKYSGRKESK